MNILLIGSGLVCAGAAVLNHYLEREFDSKMLRTRKRPIPAGDIDPLHALSFGSILVLVGISVLYTQINILTAFLSKKLKFAPPSLEPVIVLENKIIFWKI